jgi:tripartite-type tricarboxylate transporter receptor subunit TctC
LKPNTVRRPRHALGRSLDRAASLAALASSLAIAAVHTPALAAARAYPAKPIQLVVPFTAGGSADSIARILAQKLGDRLGQTVVVDNRPGAGTIVGAAYVAKAAPDGYTLLASSGSTFTVNPAIQAHLPYDPQKSFEPLAMTGSTGLILLANRDVPIGNLKAFVAAAQAAPAKYSYASFGAGTTAHFAAEALLHVTGTRLLHVPYKGSAPAMNDLIGGQVQYSVDTVTAAVPMVRAGKVKAIAVLTAKRSALLPDVPTAAESGYPGLDESTWLAVVAPKGLPPDVKAKLQKVLADVMADPDTRKRLVANGTDPTYATGAQVEAQIARELPQMRATAQRANIRLD